MLTDKEEAIRAVLEQRFAVLRQAIQHAEGENKAYYEGKYDGLSSAYDLIGDTLESICVELGEEPPVW